MSICKHFSRIFTRINSFNNCFALNTKAAIPVRGCKSNNGITESHCNEFHTTFRNSDLMEFFEEKDKWDAHEVKVGRSWRLDELRIKSNSDLHKLWFILLKEKNMLLTMEHEYKEKNVVMPNPERIHKVNESMGNLETVVRERNKAYYQLETGETGEQEIVDDHSGFGLPYKRKLTEHYVDKKYDELYRRRSIARHRMVFDKDVIWFLKRFNEKKRLRDYYISRQRYRHVCGLLKRFEGIDEEALRDEFPDVDIEQAKKDPMSRGPRLNMY